MATAMKPPQHKTVFEKSSFSSKNSRHSRIVEGFNFGYSVDIILPKCSRIPTELAPVCNEHYYLVQSLPLSKLVEEEFLEAFVKRGQVYMLSHKTNIDSDDCVALLPTGHLVLNLTKDTYEELGIDGKPSAYNGKNMRQKYVVTIDLKAAHFHFGKKNYERVRWCFTDRLDLTFDFLVTWQPNDKSICSSSVVAYWQRSGYKCEQGIVHKERKLLDNLLCPTICSNMTEETTGMCGPDEFHEWLGATLCGVNSEVRDADDYVSTLSCPEPNSLQPDGIVCRFRGFFGGHTVQNVLSILRESVGSSSLPWASLTVHGFQDSPVSWNLKEHGFYLNGDNMYTYVIFPHDAYWLYQDIATHDMCP